MDVIAPPPPPPPAAPRLSRAGTLAAAALVLIPINALVFVALLDGSLASAGLVELFLVIAVVQLVLGIAAAVSGVRGQRRDANGSGPIVAGVLAAVGAVLGAVGGLMALVVQGLGAGMGGGAWGRPLRIRGRQRHPSLTAGADWTLGARPDPTGLDPDTARALEALWLHDAQKEHASVPAFTRVAWLLAAAGAPAELLTWSHRAAIEEIAHTRACFALAAGYGGRTFTVEPMPELLLGGLDGSVDPRITLAIESLSDGCQLEDFNADVAAACAAGCEEPVTRAVLERIADEERTHADFSWAVLAWLLERHRAVVDGPLATALDRLERYPRPTAVAADKRALVARASVESLRAHGRLPDARWGELWDARLVETTRRVQAALRQVATPPPRTASDHAHGAPGSA
jgi:hypothetical protein